MRRRDVLRAASAGTVLSLSGCLNRVPLGGASRSAEVVVDNYTDETAYVSVLVEGRGGERLFTHTFVVDPDHSVGRGSYRREPTTITAFSRRGVERTWDYDPDLGPEFDCDPKDVGLTLERGAISPWYSC